ncbi:hypothetical protein SRHO_G00137350 [Serrasalmus rhombeus]
MALSECDALMGDVLPPRGKVRDYRATGEEGQAVWWQRGSVLCAVVVQPVESSAVMRCDDAEAWLGRTEGDEGSRLLSDLSKS